MLATVSEMPWDRAMLTRRIAMIESPPRRKKVSSMPTVDSGMPRALDHRAARAFSASVSGARLVTLDREYCSIWSVEVFLRKVRSVLRSSLPDVVLGSSRTGTKMEGTMCEGKTLRSSSWRLRSSICSSSESCRRLFLSATSSGSAAMKKATRAFLLVSSITSVAMSFQSGRFCLIGKLDLAHLHALAVELGLSILAA